MCFVSGAQSEAHIRMWRSYLLANTAEHSNVLTARSSMAQVRFNVRVGSTAAAQSGAAAADELTLPYCTPNNPHTCKSPTNTAHPTTRYE